MNVFKLMYYRIMWELHYKKMQKDFLQTTQMQQCFLIFLIISIFKTMLKHYFFERQNIWHSTAKKNELKDFFEFEISDKQIQI